MSWDHNLALMRYGEKWRYYRKICQEYFRKEAVKNQYSVISQKVHAMLDGLLQSPKKFEYHNKMCGTSNNSSFSCLLIVTMQVIYRHSNENNVWI
jgi:hypothetical protein